MPEETYYALLVQHSDGPCVHIAPSLRPQQQTGARLLCAAGPFPTLIRALEAQRRLAQEWGCARGTVGGDLFVKAYWGGWS